MKKLNLILIILIGIVTISCSNNDDIEESSNLNNFSINKVYISPSYSTTNCWKDIVIIDGDYTETSSEYLQNDNIKNFISFNELILPNCEIEPGIELVWDLSDSSDPNNGMEGPNVLRNIVIENHILKSAENLSEGIIYAKFKFTSQTSFEYLIKFANGQTIQNNYNGAIIVKSPYKDMGIY